jgi:FRG domain
MPGAVAHVMLVNTISGCALARIMRTRAIAGFHSERTALTVHTAMARLGPACFERAPHPLRLGLLDSFHRSRYAASSMPNRPSSRSRRPKPRVRGLKRSGLRVLASEALEARTSEESSPEWTQFVREVDVLVPAGEDPEEYWWQLETDLFYKFRARAREVHAGTLSSWDVLFTTQHYRVLTRLLDWTEVFAVALFFALDGYRPKHAAAPCIWILDPYALNRWAWGVDDLVAPANLGWDEPGWEYWSYDQLLLDGKMDWDEPTAIYPELRNARLHAQRGAFTIHGDETKPLNVQLGRKRNVLERVVLPREAIPDAVRFLRQAGFNRSDLPGDGGAGAAPSPEVRARARVRLRSHVAYDAGALGMVSLL